MSVNDGTREFVLTYGPGEAFERAAEVVRDWSRAQLISMVLHKPGGGRVEMELLRDDGWLPSLPRVGGKYWLNMPEMGVEGACDLMGVEPCPPVPSGPGRMVTGTFRHTSGEVYDLQVADERQPLGVTATHPFWSVDQQMWVSAIDLRIGETLKTLTGTTQVVSMKKRPGTETVCNIEVEGDHVYRVGESSVLVHNASGPCSNSSVIASEDVDETITCVGSRFPWTGSGAAPKWDDYRSTKAYGNFRTDHGQRLRPEQIQNAANNPDNACRQSQFYDDGVV